MKLRTGICALLALAIFVAPQASQALPAAAPPPGTSQTVSAEGAQPADQIFNFVDDTVALKPGQVAGGGYLSIRLLKPGKSLGVTDFPPDDRGVSLGAPLRIAGSGLDWLIPVKVAALDRNKTVTRHLLVTLDGATQERDYKITNATTDTYKLDIVSLPAAVSWSKDQPIAATLMVGPVAASDIHVNALLTDDTTEKRFAGGALQLCENALADCKAITELPANTTKLAYLRPSNAARQAPGKYSGTVEIIASGNRGTPANIVVYVTNGCVKALGCLLLLVGIALSLGTTLFIRNRLARAQLLAPAAALLDAFRALDAELCKIVTHNVTAVTVNTQARIGDWRKSLSVDALENASLVPPWWSVNPVSPAISQTYQTLLDNAGAWSQVLTYLIASGFEPVAKYDFSKLPSADQATEDAFTAVWTALDACAVPLAGHAAPDIAGVVTVVKTQLAAAQTAYNAALKVLPAAAPRLAEVAMPTSQHVRYQIAVLSLASWGVAALLTALVGSYALVFSHLDFGRTSDLFFCLFWGLGLPSTTAVLAQATPTSVAATVGVTLPKTP